MLTALISEFKNSIKSPDTEEKLDLLLYRPFGFLIAKIANLLGMTPSMLSLLGLALGLLSGLYFLEPQNSTALTFASFYLVLSGVFDSSDGQLARISNQSTKLGLILDGICDSIVTIAVYLSCSRPFISSYGPLFVVIMIIGLHLHSCQCAILDFYHREYLYFGYGKTENDTYWNPGISDGVMLIESSPDRLTRIMNSLRMTWIKKQQWLTTRSDSQRKIMRKYILNSSYDEKEEFKEAYRRHNLWLLPYWRLVGVNAHTILIIVFMFLRRFDIYVIAFDLIILNLIILAVGEMQKKADQKFFNELKLAENISSIDEKV